MYCEFVEYNLCYVLYIGVFFFKQKTAYEMRISDWSSDVCSSDLVPTGNTVVFSAHGVPKSVKADAAERGLRVFDATCPLVTKVHIEVEKIGRASCREGVCQYV